MGGGCPYPHPRVNTFGGGWCWVGGGRQYKPPPRPLTTTNHHPPPPTTTHRHPPPSPTTLGDVGWVVGAATHKKNTTHRTIATGAHVHKYPKNLAFSSKSPTLQAILEESPNFGNYREQKGKLGSFRRRAIFVISGEKGKLGNFRKKAIFAKKPTISRKMGVGNCRKRPPFRQKNPKKCRKPKRREFKFK